MRIRPTAPAAPPHRPAIPIYMAGVNPRMIQAAGAVGDGLVGHPLFTPEYVSQVARPALAQGAERAGRDTDVPIAGYITCSVSEDREDARRSAAAVIAFNSTVKTYDAVHRVSGFEDEVEQVRTAWREGDFGAMVEAISDEMVDTIVLAGTPDEVRSRYRERWEGVYERTLLWPPAFKGTEAVHAVIDAFARKG